MGLPRQARAVVTGAGSGLGRAICVDLARRGGSVLVTDIDEAKAQETAELVRNAGGTAEVRPCDVRQYEQVEALARVMQERFGGCDLVVNNAGVAVSGLFEDIPLEDWRWIVDINLWGVVHGCKAFTPMLTRQGSGAILNVASAAGLGAAAGMSPYNATKYAVVGLSCALHGELKSKGVSVTVLCPFFFRTSIIESGRGHGVDVAKRQALGLKAMNESKVQAPEVAQYALRAVENGTLFAVPHREARMMWRAVRLMPESFYQGVAPWVQRLLMRRG